MREGGEKQLMEGKKEEIIGWTKDGVKEEEENKEKKRKT